MTDAPDIVKRLVERFSDNIEAYRSGGYNEAQVRIEFIDRLVYELYGLMEAEIKIVEGKAKS